MTAFLKTALLGLLCLAAAMVGIVAVLGGEWRDIAWKYPWWALAAVLPFVFVAVRQLWMPRPATLRFSRASSLKRLPGGFVTHLVHLPDGLRIAAVLLLVATAARPQSNRGSEKVKHEGIDIMIALDLSVSMETPDIPPSRLEAAQFVIDDFINRRRRDRVGLVVFGSHGRTASPLTVDHGNLRSMVRSLQIGVIDGSTTAIGEGLGQALNRLQESDATSKVIVLLTDGVNNAGSLDPDDAASVAAERHIPVYTILMGRDLHGRDASVNPAQLESIARQTEGKAYTVTDVEELRSTFQDVLDELEKSSIEGDAIRPERFELFLWPALLFLLLDIVLRNTRLRRFP